MRPGRDHRRLAPQGDERAAARRGGRDRHVPGVLGGDPGADGPAPGRGRATRATAGGRRPMKRTLIHCDRCKAQLSEATTELIVEGGALASRWPEIHLCTGCASALAKFLDAPALSHPPAEASAGARVASRIR